MSDLQRLPAWVRRCLIAAGVVVALAAIAVASGHGPWRHFRGAAEDTMP